MENPESKGLKFIFEFPNFRIGEIWFAAGNQTSQ
jgi:hypothetical protein